MTTSNNISIIISSLAAVILAAGYGLYKSRRRKGEMRGKVTSIIIYPVKSCKGIEVQQAQVEKRGFQFDRLWMIVDSSGNFRTQRQLPLISQIQPSLPSSFAEPLILVAPNMPRCEVPVVTEGKTVSVRVWDDKCKAVDQGDEAAAWLSSYLGEEGLRLVRMDDRERRQVDLGYAKKGQITGFADGFPFLLTNEASLHDLNSRLESPVPMNRFRPNIVVSGPEAFAEDGWDAIRIGAMEMRVVKPCSRCKIPSIDQESGQVTQEPGRALRSYRTGAQLGIGIGGRADVYFGQNLVHGRGEGHVAVGDSLIVY